MCAHASLPNTPLARTGRRIAVTISGTTLLAVSEASEAAVPAIIHPVEAHGMCHARKSSLLIIRAMPDA